MANSSDPVLTAFVREQMRVLADHALGMSQAFGTMGTFYTTQINQTGGPLDIMDSTDLVLDLVGHKPDLTKTEIQALVAVYVAMNAAMDAAALIVLTNASSNAQNPLSG